MTPSKKGKYRNYKCCINCSEYITSKDKARGICYLTEEIKLPDDFCENYKKIKGEK